MARHGRWRWCPLALLAFGLIPACVDLQRDRASSNADSVVEQLYLSRDSGVVIEGAAIVTRLLPDDTQGSRHQRFIVRLSSGRTLLVSHNIDLADRLNDLAPGDDIAFRGEYEWNDQGGLVHWTHHDPQGERPGGWLRHKGTTYR